MKHRRFLLLGLVAVVVAAGEPQPADAATFTVTNTNDSGAGTLRQADALVILSTLDLASFHEAVAAVRDNGGEVPQSYPPNAFVATLSPEVELALIEHSALARIEREAVDPASLTPLAGQAELAAHIWNTVFRGVPDPIATSEPSGPPPERDGPDALVPPPEPPRAQTELGAPSVNQTSEFMAGTAAFSVVFVESSGGTGKLLAGRPPERELERGPPDHRPVGDR